MSDWLEQLSELEQRATKGKWYVVGAPWGDGTIVIAGNPDPHVGEYICDTDDALVMDDEQAKEHGSCNCIADAEFIAALRNNASELISRARRADEAESRVEHLERENESRYSDREAFLADANLMIQEKTRIMHEVQELTTRMPPAALKFMGYALIEAGRNP